MNYEPNKTYSNENGQEFTIISKIGDRYIICYGRFVGDCMSLGNLCLVTQSYLDRLDLQLGTFDRNSCRCGYKSETSFGVECPSCKETATFYHIKDEWNNLPPLEDIILGEQG